MKRWNHFPLEIRQLILEMLARNPSNGETSSRKTNLSLYATVSKEWQAVFERWNFGQLTLGSLCVNDLDKAFCHQRRLVKHIWLRIRLPGYDCPGCRETEGVEKNRNNAIITDSIFKLFTALSTWGQNGTDEGITLEISANSPSDSQHVFKDYHFETDAFSESLDEQDPSKLHDPVHGWVNGQRVSVPGIYSMFRIFGSSSIAPEALHWDPPVVDVVTSFMVRRQTRRQFGDKALYRILDSLPRLTHIDFEPRRKLNIANPDKFYNPLFEDHLPKTLKTLTVFEDFNENLKSFYRRERLLSARRQRHSTPSNDAPEALGKASLRLEQLSASFFIDAKDFFDALQPSQVWVHLESLALTSKLLDTIKDSDSVKSINSMLHAAGLAAQRMPRLRTMEIWTGGWGHASIFRYHIADEFPVLTWHSVWDLEFEPRVISAWKDVAHLSPYNRHELRVEKHEILSESIKSHADAIEKLVLKKSVVNRVSLMQMHGDAKRMTIRPNRV
ncbi:hypothetical protein FQN54_008981 [Arachnomyces sp. PD_36]|nr:hypothetical protein FQN54_008981 [Arachnomyces sp. PD_36]